MLTDENLGGPFIFSRTKQRHTQRVREPGKHVITHAFSDWPGWLMNAHHARCGDLAPEKTPPTRRDAATVAYHGCTRPGHRRHEWTMRAQRRSRATPTAARMRFSTGLWSASGGTRAPWPRPAGTRRRSQWPGSASIAACGQPRPSLPRCAFEGSPCVGNRWHVVLG